MANADHRQRSYPLTGESWEPTSGEIRWRKKLIGFETGRRPPKGAGKGKPRRRLPVSPRRPPRPPGSLVGRPP
jgi:hypothetical protein